MKKLRDDLCEFANKFERDIVDFKSILDKNQNTVLKISDEIYKDIRDKFVKKIAEARDNFIYVGKKEESLADIIKNTNSTYQKAIKISNPNMKI